MRRAGTHHNQANRIAPRHGRSGAPRQPRRRGMSPQATSAHLRPPRPLHRVRSRPLPSTGEGSSGDDRDKESASPAPTEDGCLRRGRHPQGAAPRCALERHGVPLLPSLLVTPPSCPPAIPGLRSGRALRAFPRFPALSRAFPRFPAPRRVSRLAVAPARSARLSRPADAAHAGR